MKNDYRESETGGFAWLADKGPREAEYDGQGALVKTPEKERPLSDYERLKEALYEFGRAGHEHMTPEAFFHARGFSDLAHSIREGRRDAAKMEKTYDTPDVFQRAVGALTPEQAARYRERVTKAWRAAATDLPQFCGADMARETDKTPVAYTDEEGGLWRRIDIGALKEPFAILYSDGTIHHRLGRHRLEEPVEDLLRRIDEGSAKISESRVTFSDYSVARRLFGFDE